MKILKLCFTFFCVLIFAFATKPAFGLLATSITPKTDSAASTAFTKNEKLKIQQMQLFAKMTVSDYEKLQKKKLNYFEKLSFRLTQHRISKMLKHYSYGDSPTVLQKISWLLKGILLGPIALLIGYLFLKDEERKLIKWIWFGFAGWLIILGIILFV